MDSGNGFESFGVVSYTTETKIPEFVEGLRNGKVMGTKCRKCGASYSPPQIHCTKCLSSDMEWQEISGQGKLLSYTTVFYGPSGFEEHTPYVIGVANFGEGRNILAVFNKSIPENQISIGMKVKVQPVTIPPNKISYEFTKAE
jgi:uncharacterized OB-fold protein